MRAPMLLIAMLLVLPGCSNGCGESKTQDPQSTSESPNTRPAHASWDGGRHHNFRRHSADAGPPELAPPAQ